MPLTITKTRRKHNTSTEEEYAGPLQLPTPTSAFSLSSPSVQQPKRLKRTRSCSDETKTASTTQAHSLTVEDYRVTGPVYLPIPVARFTVDQKYVAAWDTSLKSEVIQILIEHKIAPASINLVRCRTKRGHASPQSADYIFIQMAQPSKTDNWLVAANAILESCRQKGIDDLNVEIADARGLIPRVSAVIPSTLSIVRDWDIVLPGILDALKPNVEWLNINLVNRAPGTDFGTAGSVSFVPTILILIQENTAESYTETRDKICRLLDPQYPEVAVEVVRNCLHSCVGNQDLREAFEDHGDKLWQDKGYMGASIQPAGFDASGTLGCFVKLHFPTGDVRTYGLTNFHLVLPNHEDMKSHDAQTQDCIMNGLLPDHRQNFQINMPSEIDLEAARDSWEQRIKDIEGCAQDNIEGFTQYLELEKEYHDWEAKGEDPESLMGKKAVQMIARISGSLATHRQRIRAIDERRNKLGLGMVYAGSGIRRKSSQQIVDWALIEVDPARVPAENELPDSIHNIQIQSTQMNRIGSLALHERVFKIGRRSNQTMGFVNPVRTTELKTYENCNGTIIYKVGDSWTVMQKDQEGKMKGCDFFSRKGDSGSAVFSQDGQFVGLLHAGTVERDISYITAAEDLVEDIKQVTGAIEVTMISVPKPERQKKEAA